MKEDIIQTAVRKGIIPFTLAAFLLSGCAKTTETNSNNPNNNYEAFSDESNHYGTIINTTNNNEPNEPYKREAKIRPQPINSTVLMSREIGIIEIEVVIYGNEITCDLNIINLSNQEVDTYTITREEYMMIQDEYQKLKEKLDKNLNKIDITEFNFEFSIKMPEVKTKEAIFQEINYLGSYNDYPDDYKAYINSALKEALSGEITKRFSINPFGKENQIIDSGEFNTKIISKIDEQEIIFKSNAFGNLIIEKKPENSNDYESINFGNEIITSYISSNGKLEKYITDLKTGVVTRIYNNNNNTEVVSSYNPNTYPSTVDNRNLVGTPEKYKQYSYYDYIIAFTTTSGEVYIDVYNQETKKILWHQKIDGIKQKSIEFQMMMKSKEINFDLNYNDPDTLIDFQVPNNNFVSEKYVLLKEYIINAMNQQVKNATVTLTDEEFKVEVASENQYFRVGQIASSDSQCFYYQMKDDKYSLTYKVLENKCEIDCIGSNINWTIIDDDSETLKFKDNLSNTQELKIIAYFNVEQGAFILNGEKTVLFPMWITNDYKLVKKEY